MSANTLQSSPAFPVQDDLRSSDPLAVLRLEGADAARFLQGQVTQDVLALPADHWTRSALCTAQGRVLALPKVVRVPTGLWLVLPTDRLDTIRSHLQRFILRAKVKLASDKAVRIGLVDGAGTVPDVTACQPMTRSGSTAMLDLSPRRRLVIRTADGDAAEIAGNPGQDAAAWHRWLAACVDEGEPVVFAASAECWTPHMLAQDHWQAISLTKGCYTGQEIVARTHYLGKNKRRLEATTLPGDTLPAPGEACELPDGRRAEWVLGVATPAGIRGLVVVAAPEPAVA